MQDIFVKVLSMGINASWIIMAVMVFRLLFHKAPRWIVCFLWIIVGFKLICPFNIESSISLIPVWDKVLSINQDSIDLKDNNNVVNIQADNKFTDVNIKSKDNNYKQSEEYTQPDTSNKIKQQYNISIISICTTIWIVGIIIMLFYLFISHIYIRKKVFTATHLSDNIWESEFVNSPFILGVAKPRIYIPYNVNSKQLAYILAHENAHLARKDHILKVIAFLILSIYWFHPLVWLSYILLCRDIEFACDEKAVLLMNTQEKKEYLLTLLSCSTGKNSFNISPLSFGKIKIKERVVRMKKFKKPSVILTSIIFLTGIIISVCFLVNPREVKIEKENTATAEPLIKEENITTAEASKEKTELANSYIAQIDVDTKILKAVLPTLTLDTEKKTFCFVYNLLSSYMPSGSYIEKNNKIILTTDGGQFHYTFERGSKNTLCFVADASSPVALTDKRFGIELKNGTVFEPSKKKMPDTYSATVEAKPASVDLRGITGADGAILYYVDAEKIIFGGYFGLFVYDKASGQIVQSLDLEYIGCNHTQGDDYCSIAASKDGTKVYMKPMHQNKLYVFDTLYGELEIRDYQEKQSIWNDSSLDLFHTKQHYASYMDGKEKKICRIYESTGIIGDCQYFEYRGKEPKNKEDIVYHSLFSQEK